MQGVPNSHLASSSLKPPSVATLRLSNETMGTDSLIDELYAGDGQLDSSRADSGTQIQPRTDSGTQIKPRTATTSLIHHIYHGQMDDAMVGAVRGRLEEERQHESDPVQRQMRDITEQLTEPGPNYRRDNTTEQLPSITNERLSHDARVQVENTEQSGRSGRSGRSIEKTQSEFSEPSGEIHVYDPDATSYESTGVSSLGFEPSEQDSIQQGSSFSNSRFTHIPTVGVHKDSLSRQVPGIEVSQDTDWTNEALNAIQGDSPLLNSYRRLTTDGGSIHSQSIDAYDGSEESSMYGSSNVSSANCSTANVRNTLFIAQRTQQRMQELQLETKQRMQELQLQSQRQQQHLKDLQQELENLNVQQLEIEAQQYRPQSNDLEVDSATQTPYLGTPYTPSIGTAACTPCTPTPAQNLSKQSSRVEWKNRVKESTTVEESAWGMGIQPRGKKAIVNKKVYVVWSNNDTQTDGGSTATIWTNYGGNVTTDSEMGETDNEARAGNSRYRRGSDSDWLRPIRKIQEVENESTESRPKSWHELLCCCCSKKKSQRKIHHN